MSRQAEFLMLIGTNGTGKSTTFKKLLRVNSRNLVIPANEFDPAWKEFPKIKPKRTFVLDRDDPKGQRQKPSWKVPGLMTFTGTVVLDISELETYEDCLNVFKAICNTKNGMRGGGLFIDDFKNWIATKGTLPRHVRSMFGDRRHREIDLFLATHSFQEINMDFIQFAPKLVVYKTTTAPNKSVEGKIGNYDALLKTIKRVNQKAKTNKYYNEGFVIKAV